MPIKNPSPELLEEIRRYGFSPKTGVYARWGYHRTEEPKIFLLEDGEELPEEWRSSPADIEAEKEAKTTIDHPKRSPGRPPKIRIEQ